MKRLGKLACLAMVSMLAACADQPPPVVKIAPEMAGRVSLNVLQVSLVDRTRPSSAASPYNTNDFQPTINAALRQWVVQNIVAIGTTGEATVIIDDSSLDATKIPHEDSWFERPQASKYTAHVKIEIHAEGGVAQGNAVAEASRFITLPEQPTALERQNAYAAVFNGLMQDITTKLTAAMRAHLDHFIVNVPMSGRETPEP